MKYNMEEAITRFDLVLMSINKTVSDLLQDTKLDYTISREQLEALVLIRANGHMTVNELATNQGIFKTAASKRMNKLEKLGLIKRTASENKRIKLMGLTEEGVTFLDAIKREMAEVVEEALEGQYTVEDIICFVEQLEKFESAIKGRKVR